MTAIYISGPMSGRAQLNFPAFHAAAARLRAQGFTVVNPAEINVDPEKGWAACMRADISQLVTCDAIAMLEGWKNSRGATLEHHIASQLGMEVIDLAEEGVDLNPEPAPTADGHGLEQECSA